MKPVIMRFNPRIDTHLFPSLIECYRDVFADRPWNEWKKCPRCGIYWGLKDEPLLKTLGFLHCETPVIDFWETHLVEEEVLLRVTESASGFVAVAPGENKVIGFTWGFPATFDFIEADVKIPVCDPLRAHFGKVSEPVAFQNEIGVANEFRRQGLAKEMFKLRLLDFLEKGMTHGVVRTRRFPEPSHTFTWFTRDYDYKIIAAYPGDDGRVILAQDLRVVRDLL